MTKQEHRRRIIQGLINTLENDLKGAGAAYIYEDSSGHPLSELEVDKAEQAGQDLLVRLRKMTSTRRLAR